MIRPADDDPVDLSAVAADDELIEQLRRSLSPEPAGGWDEVEGLDPAAGLLRAVQRDVAGDVAVGWELPAGTVHPVRSGPVRPGRGRRGRHLRRGTAVAAVAAVVLSVGGVAAAAIAPGQPFGAVRDGVFSALSRVITALALPRRHQHPAPAASRAAAPGPATAEPGPAVVASPGPSHAAAQVRVLLDSAAVLLAHGQPAAARAQLDAAAVRLSVMPEGSKGSLLARLAVLRARLARLPAGPPGTGPGAAVTPAPAGRSSAGPSTNRHPHGRPAPSSSPTARRRSSRSRGTSRDRTGAY